MEKKENIKGQNKGPGFTLVFGDSFIGPLKLFKHPRWVFVKFKGGSMKGLTKPDNENRIVITNTINKFINKNKLNAVIFCFGTVDIQFSYYYSILMNKPFNPHEIISGYIEFIKSVVDPKKYKVGVQLAYPSPVKDINMIYQLETYHIVNDFYGFPKRDYSIPLTDKAREELIKLYRSIRETKRPEALKILTPEFELNKRIDRFNNFNSIIKKTLYGTNIRCVDMVKHLVDSKGIIKKEFVDPSVVNVHFRWEPQIPFMLTEFKYFGLTDKYMDDIKTIIANEKKYLQEREEGQNYIYNILNKGNGTSTHKKKKSNAIKHTQTKKKSPLKTLTMKNLTQKNIIT